MGPGYGRVVGACSSGTNAPLTARRRTSSYVVRSEACGRLGRGQALVAHKGPPVPSNGTIFEDLDPRVK